MRAWVNAVKGVAGRTTTRLSFGLLLVVASAGCDQSVTFGTGQSTERQAQALAALPAPVTDADYQYNGNPPAAVVELGRNLFFDKALSGNDDISCATCHHVFTGTGDGLSLGLGHTSVGLSTARVPLEGNRGRIVRNATHLFNLGWRGVTALTWDGEVMLDASQPSGFNTPARDTLPSGLHDILAAQNMFPAIQPREMAGNDPNNPISAAAVAKDTVLVWQLYAEKIASIPGYVPLFEAAFPDVTEASDITFAHIANALSAFQIAAFRSDNSPFDRFLRGDADALSASQQAGMELFYGEAGCANCHSGPFQSDWQYHAITIPQIGPGRVNAVNGKDEGRVRISRNQNDRFKYRTPTLRNVALNAPYGHDGAYATLEGVVRHHLDPIDSFNSYDTSQLVLPPNPNPQINDFAEFNNANQRALRIAANELDPVELTDAEVAQLIDFLHALTDPASLDLRHWMPKSVPSGLLLAD